MTTQLENLWLELDYHADKIEAAKVQLAIIETNQANMAKKLDEIINDQKEILSFIRTIMSAHDQQKGGWKVGVALSAVIASLVSYIASKLLRG